MDVSIPRRVAWAALLVVVAVVVALTMDGDVFAGITYTGGT
jgi:hypothetical protein